MKRDVVLGFRKQDVRIVSVCDDADIVKEPIFRWTIEGSEKAKLVPVRLKKESVSLNWLEEYCKQESYHLLDDGTFEHTGKEQDDLLFIPELLSAVKKEAGK